MLLPRLQFWSCGWTLGFVSNRQLPEGCASTHRMTHRVPLAHFGQACWTIGAEWETIAETDLLKLVNGYWKGVFLYWERLIVILNPNPATETSENKKKILESTVWNSRYMFCFVSSIPNLQKRRSFKCSWTIKLILWCLYEICTH